MNELEFAALEAQLEALQEELSKTREELLKLHRAIEAKDAELELLKRGTVHLDFIRRVALTIELTEPAIYFKAVQAVLNPNK